MPRLSLYKPERGQDYKFIDRQISEMFQIGCTDIYLHKYLGPKIATEGTADMPIYDSTNVTNIQDMLFLENRDRKYDTEIYRIRGHYNVQNIDFNLSQFGLFIDNDVLFMTVHINDFIKYVGRKPISGDVFELPHLVDQFALNEGDIGLPRYYVVEDVGRASEGFSATWYPHLYRLRCKKMTGGQQFADVLNQPTGADKDKFVGEYVPGTTYYTGQIVRKDGVLYQVIPGYEAPNGTTLAAPDPAAWTVYSGITLESVLSTRTKELQINDAILQQAEADAPLSGYETRQFYTLAVDPTNGQPVLQSADKADLDTSNTSYNASSTDSRPVRTGYTGYLVGDGFPINGYDFGHGIQFPEAPAVDDFFLRTDFMPNRLFRFNGSRWIKTEDAVRMTMTNTNTRQTLKTSFINNVTYIYNDAVVIEHVKLPPDVVEPETVPVDYNYVIRTTFDYVPTNLDSKYVVFKLDTVEKDYVVADHPGILSSYLDINNVQKIKVTLPSVDATQDKLPYDGVWKVGLFNNREDQRQSLSKALKPKADL